MSTRAAGVSPQVLKWARETAGLSVDEAASAIGKSALAIRDWEAGAAVPTYRQLEKLAQSVYKRPVALFFFATPPEEAPVTEDFRTLPGTEEEALAADTRFAIREARVYQLSLSELTGGRNPAGGNLLTGMFNLGPETDIHKMASALRGQLGITFDIQRRWKSADRALKAWRAAIETHGVFVFKRAISQRSVSGFCLSHPVFPLILINNSTPHTRQVFTLLHELAHLLHDVSSITSTSPGFEAALDPVSREIETRCNRFAAEVLLPMEVMPELRSTSFDPAELASNLSEQYSVSREVVLRRLFDNGLIAKRTYRNLSGLWISQAQEARHGSKKGGNYYANQATYLSPRYTDLALAQYHAGHLSRAELADYFGMRAKTVAGFEDYLTSRHDEN